MKDGGILYILPERLKECRREKGLTQKQLAEGIVTRNMISRIESGTAMPSLDVLIALAERLDVSPSYLICVSEDGDEKRRISLLRLICQEYSKGQYESCLEYCISYGEEKTEIIHISLECYYRLGVSYLCRCQAKKAEGLLKKLIILSEKSRQWERYSGEARMLVVLIYKLLSGKEMPTEVELCSSMLEEKSKNSISVFCSFYLISEKSPDLAMNLIDILPFEDSAAELTAKGIVAKILCNIPKARSSFIAALAHDPLPHLKLICLKALEEISVNDGSFEEAYSYSSERSRIISLLRM